MTLKELSEQLNVSPSTISRVLNDKPGISSKTREKVLEAVKQTGFSLNYAARNLATSEPRFIGIIGRKRGGQQDSIFFHHSMAQFEEYFEHSEYQCVNLSVYKEEVDFTGTPLSVSDFAGFIVRGQSFPVRTILTLKQTGVPIILLENKLSETDLDHVVCEDRQIAFDLTKHLIDRGYKKIVHITGPESWYNNRERIAGYTDAVTQAGLKSEILSMEDTTVDTGSEAFERLQPNKLEHLGIMMVNDAMAIGFLDTARKRGFLVPSDIGVTGFDDIPWARLAYPPLTTARVFIEQMGKLAAGRLMQMIEDPDSRPIAIRVPGEIIIREST